MAEEQYLTEKHYLVCDKGVSPKKMLVTSQNFVTFSGDKAATQLDTLKGNNFICLGKTAFMAGAVAGIAVGICAMIPGPGWLVAAIIAAAILAAVAIGFLKCKAAAATRVWVDTSTKFSIEGKKTLTLSSKMMCPAEGGTITPKETVWEAWGSAALTNLGHVANFAFGFLAGRGAVGMVGGAAGATTAAGATGLRQGAATFGKELGKQFLTTARKELIEQFTFKGFKNASSRFGNWGRLLRPVQYLEQRQRHPGKTKGKRRKSGFGNLCGKRRNLCLFPGWDKGSYGKRTEKH